MTYQTTDILSEDFEVPAHHADLQQIIEAGLERYRQHPPNSTGIKALRIKLNELINEYNERRGMKIYNRIK